VATGKLQPQLTVPNAERKQEAKAHYDKRSSKQLNEFAISEKVFVKLKLEKQIKANFVYNYGEVVDKLVPRSCAVSTLLGLSCLS